MSLLAKVLQQCNHIRIGSLKAATRCFASIENAIDRRSELFSLEQKRQKDSIGRIDKIEVRYQGLPEDVTLSMNKGMSTPYDCALHMNEFLGKKSAIALIDGKIAWDMHRPLEDSCTLQLLNFTIADPHIVNKAFWRSCSFMLGAILQETFRDEAGLKLHSFPGPNVKSGSFVYDIVLSARGWKPSSKEMRTFSAEMVKLSGKDLKFERLDVNETLAMDMFQDSPYKSEQIPNIAAQNQGKVTLYRVGSHVDISRGPMVAWTSLLGKCTISAVHEIGTEGEREGIYRVQGVALPTGFSLNTFAYEIIEERSKKLNPARLPTEPFEEYSSGKLIA